MRCAAGPGSSLGERPPPVDPSPQDPAAARRPCVRICRDRSRDFRAVRTRRGRGARQLARRVGVRKIREMMCRFGARVPIRGVVVRTCTPSARSLTEC